MPPFGLRFKWDSFANRRKNRDGSLSASCKKPSSVMLSHISHMDLAPPSIIDGLTQFAAMLLPSGALSRPLSASSQAACLTPRGFLGSCGPQGRHLRHLEGHIPRMRDDLRAGLEAECGQEPAS